MDNNLEDQLLFMTASVDNNKQVTDELNQYCDGIKKKLNKHDFGVFGFQITSQQCYSSESNVLIR